MMMNIGKGIILSLLLLLSGLSCRADNTLRRNLKRKPVESGISKTGDSDSIRPVKGMIRLSGYEKPLRSSYETVFVTNNESRQLDGVVIRIEYLDEQSRQLHQRDVELDCDIPSGETRQLRFPSWDKQKTMYYYLSPKARTSNGTPYRVKTSALLLIYKKD